MVRSPVWTPISPALGHSCDVGCVSHSSTSCSGALCTFRPPDLQGVRRMLISGFPKHLVFYRFDDGEVLVLRVAHGARDLERLFS